MRIPWGSVGWGGSGRSIFPSRLAFFLFSKTNFSLFKVQARMSFALTSPSTSATTNGAENSIKQNVCHELSLSVASKLSITPTDTSTFFLVFWWERGGGGKRSNSRTCSLALNCLSFVWIAIRHRLSKLKASCNFGEKKPSDERKMRNLQLLPPPFPIRHYLNVLFIFSAANTLFSLRFTLRSPLIRNKLLPFYVYEFGG